ncbi:MAG: hypothetical protein FWE40_09330 [Oscillospiraceae bacterium]|nr:hypothetical protein [Oscillospiraceae bacterium]
MPTKEKLLAALRKTEDGAHLAQDFWDEFVTITALVHDATDTQLAQAWEAVHYG